MSPPLPKSASPKKRGRPPPKLQHVPEVDAGGIMPLDYMLAVVRDPSAGITRRDRMAIAAAPYCHPRVTEAVKGKKALAAEKAVDVDAALVAELEQEAAIH